MSTLAILSAEKYKLTDPFDIGHLLRKGVSTCALSQNRMAKQYIMRFSTGFLGPNKEMNKL